MNTHGICYIVGAGEFFGKIKRHNNDLIIAADGGFSHLEKMNIEPDIAVGDFDSLGFVPVCKEVIRHPVMKDDTDTVLAVKTGFDRGYKTFVILGGMGGELSHTLANFQVLSFISHNGGIGFLISKNETATSITDSFIEFKKEAKGTVSIFCNGDTAEGVYLHGLLYPLTDATLTSDYPLGVSNEFTGIASKVEVKKGTLIVLWNGSDEDIVFSV